MKLTEDQLQVQLVAELRELMVRWPMADGLPLSIWAMAVDLWVLVSPPDTLGTREVISGSSQQIGEMLAQTAGRVPPGWRLLKGSAAERYLRQAAAREARRTDW